MPTPNIYIYIYIYSAEKKNSSWESFILTCSVTILAADGSAKLGFALQIWWLLAFSSNEWMMHLYSASLYTQSALQSCGGDLSSTTTSVQHPLGWCDGCHKTTAPVRSPHTSYRWRGERVIEPIKWMGIIRRPWLTRASGGNLARTPGLHPYSLQEVPWDF